MTLNIEEIRAQFPALEREEIFFDNPGGTQVAKPVLDHVHQYLVDSNANHGGAFATSRASDEVINEARAACADFYNAASEKEIVFGPNMTSLTLRFARAYAQTLEPGDTLVVTRLDHDANISPWMQVAEERGANIEWVDFDVEDGTLRMETLEAALEKKPKLVAFGYASNALGTINQVKKITEMAKSVGALVFIDAVQYAPHGPIDVQEIGCDFLVSSAYKFFSTHVGVMYGRYDLLDKMNSYKVRPAPKFPPDKWETGTNNFEGIAGVLGAMEYFEWLGKQFGNPANLTSRRERLVEAMNVIQKYELDLNRALIEVFESIPGLRLYGLADDDRLDERVPTFSFTLDGWQPRKLAEFLGNNGINVWNGNYYAIAVTERLGLEESGGMVRVGGVHYNTMHEIDSLREKLIEATES